MNITRIHVRSSQIQSIGYDAESKTLEIEFLSRSSGKDGKKAPGSVYRYANFPAEEWEKFRDADSIGSHFCNAIRGKFTGKKL